MRPSIRCQTTWVESISGKLRGSVIDWPRPAFHGAAISVGVSPNQCLPPPDHGHACALYNHVELSFSSNATKINAAAKWEKLLGISSVLIPAIKDTSARASSFDPAVAWRSQSPPVKGAGRRPNELPLLRCRRVHFQDRQSLAALYNQRRAEPCLLPRRILGQHSSTAPVVGRGSYWV